jgi:hypothetical protein
LRINEDGQFSYENKGFLAGSPAPTFEYTLSDGTDTDTAEVTINVNTNAPVANHDVSGIVFYADELGFTGGNVTGLEQISSGDDIDDFGADGAGSPAVTQVEYMGNLYSLDASNTSANPITIVTDFGELYIDNTGGYTFLKPADITMPAEGKVSLEFTYTIQDDDALNPDTDEAILTINIGPLGATFTSKDLDIDLNQTGGTIDTSFDAKAFLNVEDPASKSSPDLEDLGYILTDNNTDGLETYLAVMDEDQSAIVDIDLAAMLKESQAESIALEKGQNDQEHSYFTTVTNGLLEGGGTIISDQAAATNTPIAEFESAELL